jgi:hypothetical protein
LLFLTSLMSYLARSCCDKTKSGGFDNRFPRFTEVWPNQLQYRVAGFIMTRPIINNTEETPKRHASFLQRFIQVIGR